MTERLGAEQIIILGRHDDRIALASVGLDGVPDGYRAMNDRESIKVMVTP
jgi:hypothetical protein